MCASWQRAGAGVCARRRSNFLSGDRKSPKNAFPAVCDPFAARRGNLRRGVCGVRRGTHCALRAAFEQPRRVSGRSMSALALMPPRKHPDAGASTRGWTSTRAIAALGPGGPPSQPSHSRGSCECGRAQRWPVWMFGFCFSVFKALLSVPRSAARGAVGGAAGHPQLSPTDLPQLFERSAQRAVSSAARPAREHCRLPEAKRRDTDSRVAFLLGTFLWRRKEQVPRPPGRDPAPALCQVAQTNQKATPPTPNPASNHVCGGKPVGHHNEKPPVGG